MTLITSLIDQAEWFLPEMVTNASARRRGPARTRQDGPHRIPAAVSGQMIQPMG
jgi:hypothetical protein